MGVEVLGNVNDPAYQEKLRAQAAAKAQAAQSQAQQQAQPVGQAEPQPDPVGVGYDVAAGVGSGALRGFIGMPEAPMDVAAMVTDLFDFAQRKWTGESKENQQARLKNAGPGSWGISPVNTDDFRSKWGSEAAIRGASEDLPWLAPALNYKPQTWGGRIGQVAGEASGGNVLGVVGAGLKAGTHAEKGYALVKELIAQGFAPGAASEAAGQIADRYAPEEWGTAVRALTGIGTSAATGTMHNVTGPPNRVTIPGIEDPVRSTAAAHVGQGVRDTGGPEAVQGELNAVGPGGRLADASDPLRGQTEQVFIEPGPSQTNVRRFLNERARTMGGSDDTYLNQALNTIIEPRAVNFAEQSLEMRDARRRVANDLYADAERAAGNRPIPQDRALAYINASVPDDVLAGTRPPLAEHTELMGLRDQLTGERSYRDLDNLKNVLNRRLETNYNPDLAHVRDSIVESLETATRNPLTNESSYRNAQRAYREDSGILEQSQAGRKFFDSAETADDFRLRWRDLTDDERTAYRMGLREAVGAKMDLAANDFTTGSNALRTINNQKKLETILGEGPAAHLQERVEGLRRQRGTTQGIVQQSATAGRLRGRSMIENPDEPIAKIPLSRVQTLGGVGSLAAETIADATAGNWLRNRKRTRALESNADQSRILIQDLENVPPDQRLAMLRRLQEVYETQGNRRFPARRDLLALQSAYQTDRSEENNPLKFSVGGRKKQ